MRTIKFRGKRLYDGKWVYGYVLGHDTLPYMAIVTMNNTDKSVINKTTTSVEPETIGQFTGLYDKNGEEIYEGDIVEVYDFTSAYASKYRGVVKMYGGSWCVEYEDSIFDLVAHPRLFFDDFADRKTEVIGNIHSNPKLLENEKD